MGKVVFRFAAPRKMTEAGKCCALITFVVVLAVAILIPVSIKVCQYDEWCLEFDTTHQTVGSTTVMPGRYFLGPTKDFKRFSSTFQYMEFTDSALGCPTNEARAKCFKRPVLQLRVDGGQTVKLEIGVQFRHQKDKLKNLYETVKPLDLVGDKIAIDTQTQLNAVSIKYQAKNFFYNRTAVVDSLRTAMDGVLNQRFFEMEDFQVHHIYYPSIQNADGSSFDMEQEFLNVQLSAYQLLVQNETAELKTVVAKNEQKVKTQLFLYTEEYTDYTTTTDQYVLSIQATVEQVKKDTDTMLDQIQAATDLRKGEINNDAMRIESGWNLLTYDTSKQTEEQVILQKASDNAVRITYQDETENLRLETETQEIKILSDSDIDVAQMNAVWAEELTKAEQETARQSALLTRNLTLAKEQTTITLATIAAGISQAQAFAQEEMEQYRAAADAYEIGRLKATQADGTKLVNEATLEAYTNLKTGLTATAGDDDFGANHLLRLKWSDSFSKAVAEPSTTAFVDLAAPAEVTFS